MDIESIKEKYACDMSLEQISARARVTGGKAGKQLRDRLKKYGTKEALEKAASRKNDKYSTPVLNLMGAAAYFKAILQQKPATIEGNSSGRQAIDSIVSKIRSLAEEGLKKTNFAGNTQLKLEGRNP